MNEKVFFSAARENKISAVPNKVQIRENYADVLAGWNFNFAKRQEKNINNFREKIGKKSVENLRKNLSKIREQIVRKSEQLKTLETFFADFWWKSGSFARFFHAAGNNKTTSNFREIYAVNSQVFHSFHRAYYYVLLFLIKERKAEENFAK